MGGRHCKEITKESVNNANIETKSFRLCPEDVRMSSKRHPSLAKGILYNPPPPQDSLHPPTRMKLGDPHRTKFRGANKTKKRTDSS